MATEEGIAKDSGAISCNQIGHNGESTDRKRKDYKKEFIIITLKSKTPGSFGFTGELY